ncbi:serpin family protein [Methanoculleus palmolei]|jgi:serpin B|uniref:Serpin family protein n=3 Tax=Methanoculleus TaxID=45989 RepID=A0ABD8A6G5_9EURY|nr:serpin family protein [Methanoculleus palmolei]
MSRDGINAAILALIVALGGIVAGCTDTPGTTSAGSAPPTGEETPRLQQTAESAGNVTAGSNQFAFDLYSRLANDPAYAGRNLFFSPYSISSALAITYEGAHGTTADEIRSVLHLPENDTLQREGFSAIDAGLNRADANYILRTANALWAEETYSFLPEYTTAAARWYGANVTNLDFKGSPEASRETINRWVEEQTEDKIRDLLPAGSIDTMTRLVITNAIYFKGTWVKQFDANETEEEDFRIAPNETVRVPMMQRTDRGAVYGYTETDTLQVLEMPYARGNGSEVSMLVLLPKEDSLTAAEESLDAETVAGLHQSLTSRRVDVFFPKFRLETDYSLPGVLAAMGMPTVFTDSADLSGMDGMKKLFVSDIVHKAFVDVNEEGTEAAAATGVIVAPLAAPPGSEMPIPVFRADHPFVFLIVEEDSGTVLFIGRVVNQERL